MLSHSRPMCKLLHKAPQPMPFDVRVRMLKHFGQAPHFQAVHDAPKGTGMQNCISQFSVSECFFAPIKTTSDSADKWRLRPYLLPRPHTATPSSLASFGQKETDREIELRQNWLFTVLRIVSYPTCSFGSPVGPCQKSASYSTNVTPPSFHFRRTRNGFLSGCSFKPRGSACKP